jgi:hypothetical protein
VTAHDHTNVRSMSMTREAIQGRSADWISEHRCFPWEPDRLNGECGRTIRRARRVVKYGLLGLPGVASAGP